MNKIKYYYLSLDVETGGIGDDKSLLTAFFGFHDDEFNLLDSLNLQLKPDDGVYHVAASGMAINGIDLVKHDPQAMTYKQGGTALYNFLQNCAAWAKGKTLCAGDTYDGKLIPIGHNLAMDIRKVKQFLVSEGTWTNFVSYRCLDTASISQFLRIKGFLPQDLSCSGESLAGYLGITGLISGKAHDARYDALTTVETLKKLLELS